MTPATISLWLKLLPTILQWLGMLATAFSTHNFDVLGSQGAVENWTTLLQTFGLGGAGGLSMIAGVLTEIFKNGKLNGVLDNLTARLKANEAPSAGITVDDSAAKPPLFGLHAPGLSITIDPAALVQTKHLSAQLPELLKSLLALRLEPSTLPMPPAA